MNEKTSMVQRSFLSIEEWHVQSEKIQYKKKNAKQKSSKVIKFSYHWENLLS